MKPPPAMTGHSMADQIDLKQLFTQALEQGLEHGTDALVAKMVEAYNITEDQVRGHLLEIYPPQGEFRAVLRINNDSVINWFGSINLTGAPSFEIKRGHMMIVEDAFGGTMPTGHEGIFMRLGTYMRWRPKFQPRNIIPITSKRGISRYVRKMRSGMFAGKYREPIFEFTGPQFSTLAGSQAMQEVFYTAAVDAMARWFEEKLK